MAITADPNPTLLAELESARAVLAPQIRGMADTVSMRGVTLTDAARAKVQAGLDLRTERDNLLANTIAAYHNLEEQLAILVTNGYPALPKIDVLPTIFTELQGEKSDIDIALGEFESEPVASTGAFTFPAATPKS